MPMASLSRFVLGVFLCVAIACEKAEESPPDTAILAHDAAAGQFIGIHDPSGDEMYLLDPVETVFDLQDQCRELCTERMGTWYEESGHWVCRCEIDGTRYLAKQIEEE